MNTNKCKTIRYISYHAIPIDQDSKFPDKIDTSLVIKRYRSSDIVITDRNFKLRTFTQIIMSMQNLVLDPKSLFSDNYAR